MRPVRTSGPTTTRRAWRTGHRARAARGGCRPPPPGLPGRRRPGPRAAAVERRWAITTTVRPSMRRSSASSMTQLGAGVEAATSPRRARRRRDRPARPRTSETSWRSPPEKLAPRSRTSVSSPSGNAANRGPRSSASIAAQSSASVGVRARDRAGCRGWCRRTGSPPGARRRCVGAASASVRRGGRRRRSARSRMTGS